MRSDLALMPAPIGAGGRPSGRSTLPNAAQGRLGCHRNSGQDGTLLDRAGASQDRRRLTGQGAAIRMCQA